MYRFYSPSLLSHVFYVIGSPVRYTDFTAVISCILCYRLTCQIYRFYSPSLLSHVFYVIGFRNEKCFNKSLFIPTDLTNLSNCLLSSYFLPFSAFSFYMHYLKKIRILEKQSFRNLVFVTHSNFLVPKYFQPDDVKLNLYFKLRLFYQTEFLEMSE